MPADFKLDVLYQVPIVAAFIWFCLQIVDRFLQAQKEQTDKHLEAQRVQTDLFVKSVETLTASFNAAQQAREANMQQFMGQMQDNHAAGMARLAEEQKGLSSTISASTEVITRHDAKNDALMQQIVQVALAKKRPEKTGE
jgi:hypothetical protein